jgi:hypothetical protein
VRIKISMRGMALAGFIMLGLSAIAVAGPAGSSGGGGGGSISGPSNPGTGPVAPASPVPAAFKSFYVVANGQDPNFQTYVSELSARVIYEMGYMASGVRQPAPPLYVVSAPGWNEDTLTSACKADSNMIGGIVIEFTSFYTEGGWLLINTETEHVTPSIKYLACYNSNPVWVTPTIAIHTLKSAAQWTVPLGPVAGAAALVFPTRQVTNTTSYTPLNSQYMYSTATQQNAIPGVGSLGALAIAGSLSSANLGVLNPGHEALDVAKGTAIFVGMITKALCNLGGPTTDIKLSRAIETTKDNVSSGSESFLDPSANQAIYPPLDAIKNLRATETSAITHKTVDSTGWTAAAPAPSGYYNVTVDHYGSPSFTARIVTPPTDRPSHPTSPLTNLCTALGPPSLPPSSKPLPAPSPMSH